MKDTIEPDRVLAVISEWASETVPVQGLATFAEQERREMTIPFLVVKLVEVLQQAYWDSQEKIREQREELIEAKKEVSRLKRAKK